METGGFHPDAAAVVDVDQDELFLFWYLDQSGMTYEEYEREPMRITRRRMAWYQAKAAAKAKPK